MTYLVYLQSYIGRTNIKESMDVYKILYQVNFDRANVRRSKALYDQRSIQQ